MQPPFPADDKRYQGAKVYGHVATVQRAGGMKKGGVTLGFDRLTLTDGTTAALQGQALSFDAQGNKANSTAKTIVGGVVGQIVGNYIGKHIGTDVGGAIGAIGGAIYAANTGQNITVTQGTTVSMKTTAPATVSRAVRLAYPNGNNNGGYQQRPERTRTRRRTRPRTTKLFVSPTKTNKTRHRSGGALSFPHGAPATPTRARRATRAIARARRAAAATSRGDRRGSRWTACARARRPGGRA